MDASLSFGPSLSMDDDDCVLTANDTTPIQFGHPTDTPFGNPDDFQTGFSGSPEMASPVSPPYNTFAPSAATAGTGRVTPRPTFMPLASDGAGSPAMASPIGSDDADDFQDADGSDAGGGYPGNGFSTHLSNPSVTHLSEMSGKADDHGHDGDGDHVDGLSSGWWGSFPQNPFGGPAHTNMPSVATPLLATPVVTAPDIQVATTTANAFTDAVRGHSSTPGCSPTAPLVASPSTGGFSGYAARRAPPTEPIKFKTFKPAAELAPEPVPQQARSPRCVADADATTLSFSSGLLSSLHAAAPLAAAAPQRREIWTEAEQPMAFLAYDACMRVCLSAVLKDGAPWAKMFLGDGDTVPLQKCFALESHLIQRLSDKSEAKATPAPPRSPYAGAAGGGGVGAMVGVEHRVRVEIQALNIVEPHAKKQKLWNHWPKALGESKSKSSRKSSSTSMAKLPQAAAADGDEHQMEGDARKEASEEIEVGAAGATEAAVGGKEAVAGVKEGELPTPADLVASAEFEFNGCNPFKRKRPSDAAAGSRKAGAGDGGEAAADASTAAAATAAAEFAHAAGVVGKAAGKAAGKAMGKASREAGKATGKLLTAAAGLFRSPYDASKAPPPPPTLQCKVFLAKAGGQRVGESQFLAPHADVNTAEFVREDDGEVCVHFEMHDGAETSAGGGAGGGVGGGGGGGGHKAVYSTQLPLAALDGRTTVTVFREGKACGSLQLAVTEEERVVRKRGGAGADADTQDADQLLCIYDLVVRVALQEEGVGPRRLRMLGPWQALLNQFSAKFNVRTAYCELRLLSHVMDVANATPTADCLGVLLEKLPPLLQQRQQGQLVEREAAMLAAVSERAEETLTFVFQHYKALSEAEPSGVLEGDAPCLPAASLPAPALPLAMKLLKLFHRDDIEKMKEVLMTLFKKAAQHIFSGRKTEAATAPPEKLSLAVSATFAGACARRLSPRARGGVAEDGGPAAMDEQADVGLLQRGGGGGGNGAGGVGGGGRRQKASKASVGVTPATSWERAAAEGSMARRGIMEELEKDEAAREYAQLVYLCRQTAQEVKTDIMIHDTVPALQFVKMPCITAHEHCKQLRDLVRSTLRARPPKAPAASVINLMYALDDLQRKLVGEWRIGGGLEKRLCVPDVFGEYIGVWLKRTRMDLWEVCDVAMGIRTMGHPVHNGEPRDFVAAVDALYTALRSTLKGTGTSYDRILSRWTTYLPQVEAAVCDVESKLMQALLDDCGGAIRRASVPKGSALHTVKVAKDKAGAALHHMKENLGHGMTAAVKAVKAVNKGKGKGDVDGMHPALATPVGDRARSRLMESQQTALQESVSQAHMPLPVIESTGASTECMSAEEVLLPKKWKVVLMTLRAMLDRRPEIEDILQTFNKLEETRASLAPLELSTKVSGDLMASSRDSFNGGVPFGTRFSTNTGGVRHHYMRHIKFVVENIHREICRSRTTSIQAVLQQRGLVDRQPEEVLAALTDLLATVFATLGDALGTGHVITTVLRGVWDNLAFDALCHLEEDDSRDWRKSLLVGQIMVLLDGVFVDELRTRGMPNLTEKEYPSNVKKIHNVLQTSKQTKDSFDMYS